jgi:hypothetical protein
VPGWITVASDPADLHYPASREMAQIGSYTSEREKARDPVDVSAPEVVKAHDKARRKTNSEFKADSRDQKFKTKVFWAALTVLTIADYLYLPVVMPDLQLPWFGHAAMVVSATFLCVILVTRLHILRTLRRVVTTVVVIAVLLGVCALLGLLPHAY